MQSKVDQYFAVAPPGCEKVCAAELAALGISPGRLVHGGVEFSGTLRELYLANLWLRSASRVLVRLGEFSARDFPGLFQRLARLPWGRYVKLDTGCEVRAVAAKSRLSHTGRIAETCTAAIDRALGRDGGPSSSERQGVYLRIQENRCQVSIDSSGEHLHRRGYLKARSAAPLRETLAAACLLRLGYDGGQPLIDLMAGSGTIVVEAAMLARHRAPGIDRAFMFMAWPKYRRSVWEQLLDQARAGEIDEADVRILAVDNNPKAVSAIRQNLTAAGLAELVEVNCIDLREVEVSWRSGLLICNPPYGERLGRNAALGSLYRDLGRLYAERFASWDASLICPEGGLLRQTGLLLDPLLRFSNGGIPVALHKKILPPDANPENP